MNKKIIVLIEIVVCVMAIVVVSLFGLQAENWRDTIYATSIEFYEPDATLLDASFIGEEGELQINLDENMQGYQIKYRVLPDNTTNSKVEFSFSNGIRQENGTVTDGDCTVTEDGWLYFKSGRVKSVNIIARTTDGSNKVATLRVRVNLGGGGTLPL